MCNSFKVRLNTIHCCNFTCDCYFQNREQDMSNVSQLSVTLLTLSLLCTISATLCAVILKLVFVVCNVAHSNIVSTRLSLLFTTWCSSTSRRTSVICSVMRMCLCVCRLQTLCAAISTCILLSKLTLRK